MSDDPKQNAPGTTPGSEPSQPQPGRPVETPSSTKPEAGKGAGKPEPAKPARAEPAPQIPGSAKPAQVEPIIARTPAPPEPEKAEPTAAAHLEPTTAAAAPIEPAPIQRTAIPPSQADSAAPLDAISRRIANRLQRTEQTLSPWTQRTLRQQRASEPGAGETAEPSARAGESRPEQPPLALTGSRLQSLTQRVQRREEQAATGTFGGMAAGVQRADRFTGSVTAHYPEIAAKYEPKPAPEGSATGGQAPAGSGPTFTYYPEGGGSGQSRGPGASAASREPTMSAAEVLRRYGSSQPSTTVQRAPAAPAAPAAQAAPTTPAQPARDIRKLRRFSKSKVEELPPQGEPEAPAAEPVQRKPESAPPEANARPTPPPRRAPAAENVPAPAPSDETRPVRRGPTDEPATEPAAPPPAPGSGTPAPATPLRWDHLNNLPPSVQRQLERVQRTLAEEAGQITPPPTTEAPRPFRPRNPNPPPTAPAQPPAASRPQARPEAEPPIAFGPDLTPRPAAVQRQTEPPAPAQLPAESGRAERQGPPPVRPTVPTPLGPPAPTPPVLPSRVDRPEEAPAHVAEEPLMTLDVPPAIQRSPAEPAAAEEPALQTKAQEQARPEPTEPAAAIPPDAGRAGELLLRQPIAPRSEPAAPTAPETRPTDELPFAPSIAPRPEPTPSRPPDTGPAEELLRRQTIAPRTEPAAPAPAETVPTGELPLKQPIAPPTEPAAPAARGGQTRPTDEVPLRQRAARTEAAAPPAPIQAKRVEPATSPAPLESPASERVDMHSDVHSAPENVTTGSAPQTQPDAAEATPAPVSELPEEPVVQRTPLTESPPEQPLVSQPLVLRAAPEPPATPASPVAQDIGVQPAAESQPPAQEDAGEASAAPWPSEPDAGPPPNVPAQAPLAPQRPAEQPLILREPAPPARSERLPAAEARPPLKPAAEAAQVQRSPEQAEGQVVPPSAPPGAGTAVESSPRTAIEQAEAPAPVAVQPAPPTSDVQRSEIQSREPPPTEVQPVDEQPLILREQAPAVPETAAVDRVPPEPAPQRLEPPGPAGPAPREISKAEALPLVTPTASPRSQVPAAAGTRSASKPPAEPIRVPPPAIQRRAQKRAEDVRPEPEPEARVTPAAEAIPPAAPPPVIQRSIDPAAAAGPALEMPLREPLPARTSSEPGEPEQRPAPGPGSLSTQVYARAVRGANMPRVGTIPSGARRPIQRQPATPAGRGPEPLTFAGPPAESLARSSRVATPVLPQARLQLEEAGPTELRPTSQPAGTLPLARRAPSPAAGIQREPTTTGQTRATAAPSRTLPLAPVGNAPEKNGGKTQTDDKAKVDRPTGSNQDAEADKTSDEMKEIDLDELAEKVLPIVKRLIAIERERHEPI